MIYNPIVNGYVDILPITDNYFTSTLENDQLLIPIFLNADIQSQMNTLRAGKSPRTRKIKRQCVIVAILLSVIITLPFILLSFFLVYFFIVFRRCFSD